MMKLNTKSHLFLLCTTLLPSVLSIRPYVTCVGCDTFVECFLMCPMVDYPGANRFGVYVPDILTPVKVREIPRESRRLKRRGRFFGPRSRSRSLPQPSTWFPYDPSKYTNYPLLNQQQQFHKSETRKK